MPVVFNEPLSFLQRITENMEYYPLLVQANSSDNAVTRFEVPQCHFGPVGIDILSGYQLIDNS